MTRRETVNLLLELKDYNNHNQGKDNPNKNNSNVGLIVGLSIGGAIILGGASYALIMFFKKRKLNAKISNEKE